MNYYSMKSRSFNLTGLFGGSFRDDLSLGYRNNAFSHAYTDSVTRNRSQTITTDNTLNHSLSAKWALGIEYTLDYKWYSTKTEQDPDYFLHYVQADVIYDISSDWSIKCGISVYILKTRASKAI